MRKKSYLKMKSIKNAMKWPQKIIKIRQKGCILLPTLIPSACLPSFAAWPSRLCSRLNSLSDWTWCCHQTLCDFWIRAWDRISYGRISFADRDPAQYLNSDDTFILKNANAISLSLLVNFWSWSDKISKIHNRRIRCTSNFLYFDEWSEQTTSIWSLNLSSELEIINVIKIASKIQRCRISKYLCSTNIDIIFVSFDIFIQILDIYDAIYLYDCERAGGPGRTRGSPVSGLMIAKAPDLTRERRTSLRFNFRSIHRECDLIVINKRLSCVGINNC